MVGPMDANKPLSSTSYTPANKRIITKEYYENIGLDDDRLEKLKGDIRNMSAYELCDLIMFADKEVQEPLVRMISMSMPNTYSKLLNHVTALRVDSQSSDPRYKNVLQLVWQEASGGQFPWSSAPRPFTTAYEFYLAEKYPPEIKDRMRSFLIGEMKEELRTVKETKGGAMKHLALKGEFEIFELRRDLGNNWTMTLRSIKDNDIYFIYKQRFPDRLEWYYKLSHYDSKTRTMIIYDITENEAFTGAIEDFARKRPPVYYGESAPKVKINIG